MSRQTSTHTPTRIVTMIISSIALVELLVHLIFHLSKAEAWISETTRILIDVVALTSVSSFAVLYWVFKPFKLAEQQALLNSALQAAVKEANEERAKTAAIIAAIGDGISILDTEFRITYQNETHKRMVGDHLGEYCYRAYENKEQVCDDCAMELSFKDGGIHTVERCVPAEQGAVHVEITSSPLRDAAGTIIAGIEVVRDITVRRQWEQALKDQWHLAASAIQNSAVATFVLDPDHRVVVWNKACEVLTGHSAASIIGTSDQWLPFYALKRPTLADIVIDGNVEDLPALYRKDSHSEREPDGLHAEGWFYNVNGKDRYIIFDASAILDRQGQLVFSVETLQDITERKQAEDLIRESEKRYHSLFDNAHEMIQSVAPDGHFLFVNPAWKKVLGYTQEDLQALTVFDILHASCKPQCMALFKQALSGQTIEFLEAKFVAKDGRIIDIEGNASVNVVDGNVVATQGILRDVTERNRLEQQIFIAKQDWEETFNTITDMVTVHDRDYTIIRANKAAERILGLPLLDRNKVKCFNDYHGSACPPDGCPSCQSLLSGKPSTSEIYEPHLKMFIEIRAIPRLDQDGTIAGLIHVVRDISERKKLEAQLLQAQKMEAVGQLAGGVAHDFNNILTAILGDAYILGMKLGPENPLLNYVDDIRTSAEKAAALTQSLLAFSRKQVINPKPMSLNAVVQRMEKLMTRIIREDISLKTVQAGPELMIMADGGQIEQVIMNLVSNARDSMPQGGTLTISTGPARMDEAYIAKHGFGNVGDYALLSVADKGTGMDAKTRERIFEPFFTTKEVGKGTGLGLSIVYGIIKQHSGFIDCHSAPGAGTVFNIYLPLVDNAQTAANRTSENVPDRGREYILLAEDDAKVRETTRAIIEEFGYQVIAAEDGEDAVRKYNENRDTVRLVIMDVVMPKKNGKDAYDEIKATRPDVKVLFLSGYADDIIHRKGILDEGLNFMSKPSSPVTLLSRIREILDR